ncbi:GTP pyrophosphokinase [Clavibacter tessellarius]|uniref:GTP pyrophosphokinase n=1 Tax=Clavibacter tessellarius TaxID=31965 RepID=UPI0039E89BAA
MPRKSRPERPHAEVLHDSQPRFRELLSEGLYTLDSIFSENGIKTHSITGRVKDVGSALEKINRKQYADPLQDMEDLVGLRVVCLFLDDLSRIRAAIHDSFSVLSESNTVDGDGPEAFGYKSHHYVCSIKEEHAGPRYDRLKGYKFEIQCRTIAMDAWASISHYLAYKGSASVPEELLRDFNALSGLFYVADRHFQHFATTSLTAEQESVKLQITNSDDANTATIDRASVTGLFQRVYKDREQADPASISQFVEETKVLKFDNIGALAAVLEEYREAALEAEEASPPFNPESGERDMYMDVGLARATLDLAYPKLRNQLRRHRSFIESA